MSGLMWKSPPPAGSGRSHPGNGKRIRFVAELKKRPGEWALYGNFSHASMITHNKRAFPGTDWTSRKQADGTVDLYARWVGES